LLYYVGRENDREANTVKQGMRDIAARQAENNYLNNRRTDDRKWRNRANTALNKQGVAAFIMQGEVIFTATAYGIEREGLAGKADALDRANWYEGRGNTAAADFLRKIAEC
jgi:hypothetical protein